MTEVGLPLGNEAEPYSPVVAKLVSSIIVYSTWPQKPSKIDVCLVGPAEFADRLVSKRISGEKTLSVKKVSISTVAASGCNVAYLGRLSMQEQRAVTAGLKGQPVLVIAENDPACRSNASICLLFQADSLSFRMNLDALSRSGVRIDPRVLRMGEQDPA
nr:YfiR family protein [Parerythrobacter lacustris]